MLVLFVLCSMMGKDRQDDLRISYVKHNSNSKKNNKYFQFSPKVGPDVCIHGRILIAGLEVSAVAWQQYWQFINSTFPENHSQLLRPSYTPKSNDYGIDRVSFYL